MSTLTIGRLAQASGVNVETIRYYERRGILPPPPRRESGYRQYSPDYIAWIRFIKRAQTLGFSLAESAELLALQVESHAVCNDVQQRTQAKIDEIEQKIQTLQRIQQTLMRLRESCASQTSTEMCPILTALAGEEGDRQSETGRAGHPTRPLAVVTAARLTCPVCGQVQVLEMPSDACQYFFECPHCYALLKPRSGDCCIFCSYADVACPPRQQAKLSGPAQAVADQSLVTGGDRRSGSPSKQRNTG